MGKLRPRGRSLLEYNCRVPCGPHFTSSTLSPHFTWGKTEHQREKQETQGSFVTHFVFSFLLGGSGLQQELRKVRIGSLGMLLPAGLGGSARAVPASVGRGVRFSCSTIPSSLWPGRLILTTTNTFSKGTPALCQDPVKPLHALPPIFSPSRQMTAFLPSRRGRRAFLLLLAGTANGTGRGWGHRAGDVLSSATGALSPAETFRHLAGLATCPGLLFSL